MSSNGTDFGTTQQGVLLLTVDQAAALCQVSRDMVYQWTRQPGFPTVRGPHQVRIHARLFQEWLERRALEANSEPEEVSAA